VLRARPTREVLGGEGERERARVGQHVTGVGHQGQAARREAHDGLDNHEQGGDGESQNQASQRHPRSIVVMAMVMTVPMMLVRRVIVIVILAVEVLGVADAAVLVRRARGLTLGGLVLVAAVLVLGIVVTMVTTFRTTSARRAHVRIVRRSPAGSQQKAAPRLDRSPSRRHFDAVPAEREAGSAARSSHARGCASMRQSPHCGAHRGSLETPSKQLNL
jgi:hypothetical protein